MLKDSMELDNTKAKIRAQLMGNMDSKAKSWCPWSLWLVPLTLNSGPRSSQWAALASWKRRKSNGHRGIVGKDLLRFQVGPKNEEKNTPEKFKKRSHEAV